MPPHQRFHNPQKLLNETVLHQKSASFPLTPLTLPFFLDPEACSSLHLNELADLSKPSPVEAKTQRSLRYPSNYVQNTTQNVPYSSSLFLMQRVGGGLTADRKLIRNFMLSVCLVDGHFIH
ncbi:hypothetical protein Pfo_001036 [Paulownia fortunei]|nr:hypothetical protein Pfo_001036 [Paulownia fortunei]